jgi:hypothetical protein
MKKIIVLLGFALVFGSALILAPLAKASSQPVTDAEFLPDANYYGESYPPFVRACTRFVPTRTSYTNYLDLAVKNGKGSAQPITVSLRNAAGALPGDVIKAYTQSTFNNYADGSKTMSRFVSNDQEAVSVTIGANYWLCIETIDSDSVNSGWFYKANGSGYSYRGINADPSTDMPGISFGYRTYAYNPVTPPTDTGDTTGTGTGTSGTTTGTTGSTGTTTTTPATTGNSNQAQGAAPSTNVSSSIVKPTAPTATISTDNKSVVLSWKASTTTTIGGYNIYRSETSGMNYQKIGDTGKSTVTFTDSTIVAGKSYYYMIRAYKDTAESANSDEVRIIVPASATAVDQAAPAAVSATPSDTSEDSQISVLFWVLCGVVLVLTGLLVFLMWRRHKRDKAKKIQLG